MFLKEFPSEDEGGIEGCCFRSVGVHIQVLGNVRHVAA